MSRRGTDRPVRWVAHAFATIVALAVTMTIIGLFFGLLAIRFVGLSTYVVQGAPAESMVPIGSLVLVVPSSDAARAGGDASPAPIPGTAWVAIPTLGYAVTYAEAYSSPILMGLVIWTIFIVTMRALAPYMSTARRRLPA